MIRLSRNFREDKMKKLLIICSVLLLFALLWPLMGASATRSLVIDVSEDAYIVADVNDAADTYGFRDKNYGDLDFVKAWYLWNVETQEAPPVEEGQEPLAPVEVEKEKVISIIYLKFDLSELKDVTIDSAMLQCYTNNVVLLTPRYLQAFQVSSDWDELTLTFNNAPPWGQTALATTIIYQVDRWYGWDVTEGVNAGASSGQVSLAVMLRDMDKASEELVAFPSRETGENFSRLIITYTQPGFVFAWYWWVIIGVVVLALLALAFFGGMKLRSSKK
jgi:hypothetical protein